MRHVEQVTDLVARWAAGQASQEWDIDCLWGPLRTVSHAQLQVRREATRDGVLRGARQQECALTSVPDEALLEHAARSHQSVVIGIDLTARVEGATVQPGSVAAGAVPGLRPARRAVTLPLDLRKSALQVVCTPHGWKIVDVQDVMNERGVWFSDAFCTHGFALVLPGHDTQDPAELRAAAACGVTFRSLAAHVRVRQTGLNVAHTLQVANARGDDVVVCFGVTQPASKGLEEGYLVPAHSARVLAMPNATERRVVAPLRLRGPSTSRFRRPQVDHLQLGVSIPEGHPVGGWCRVPVQEPALAHH